MASPSSNFVVSSSVMIKFGVVIESDKFAPKSQIFKDVTAEFMTSSFVSGYHIL